MISNQKAVSSPAGDFVGRREELDYFRHALVETTGKKLRGFLLSGEPGIGKTRLAEECALTAEQNGITVLWGRWREGTEMPEYQVWTHVIRGLLQTYRLTRPGLHLDPVLSELSVLIPELLEERPDLSPPLSGTGSRSRLFNAVFRLLRRSCFIGPLMLVFDNLHLAGAASLELLEGMFDELAEWAILPLATCQDIPAWQKEPFRSFLSEARKRRDIHEFRLAPLDSRDTAILVENVLGYSPPDTLAPQIFHRTQGNPLFVREAARLARDRLDRSRQVPEQVWEEALPEAVNGTISRRFLRLSAGGMDVLKRAASIGETFTEEELELTGWDSAAGVSIELLDEGVEYGFIHHGTIAGEYHFSHPLIHAAVRLQMPAAERRRLCVTLVREVERRFEGNLEPRALRLTGWWSQIGGKEAQERVRSYTVMAAETALRAGAWEEAVSLFSRVIGPENTECTDERQAEICFGIGRAVSMSGDRPGAVRYFKQAFEWYHRTGGFEKMFEIATQPGYLNTGEPGFYNFFEEVLTAVPPGSTLEGLVLCSDADARINSLGDYIGAARSAQKAYRIGCRTGSVQVKLHALIPLLFLDISFSRYARASDRLAEASRLLHASGDPVAHGHVLCARGTLRLALGKPREAVADMEKATEYALEFRDAFFIATGYYKQAVIEALGGAWDRTRQLIDEGLAACSTHWYLLALRAFLEYTVGDTPAGDTFRERILSLSSQIPAGPWYIHIHAAATAAVRARNTGITEDLESWLPPLASITLHPDVHPRILLRARLLQAFIAAQTDDAATARKAYDAVGNPSPPYLIRPYLTERFLGLAANCFGDRIAAVIHLTEALRLARHFHDEPIEAWILCELGETRSLPGADAPETTDACDRLLEAQKLAHRLGMVPLEQRARTALGRIASGADPAPLGTDTLSDRERRILSLVAEGLPYPAIVRLLGLAPADMPEQICRAELDEGGRPLSRRELEIAHLLRLRLTAAEISGVLGISRRTVERHMANMYDKLHIGSRRELLSRLFGNDESGR